MAHPTSVVLVGAGMANTFVLLRIVSALSNAFRFRRFSGDRIASKLKITLLNADLAFAGGVAYGQTDPCMLLNTPISLIEPNQEFREWLEDNLDWIADCIQTKAGNAGRLWLQQYLEPLQRGDYLEINLPRMIYGLFLKAQLRKAADLLKQINERYGTTIQLELLAAKVNAIQRREQGFELWLQGNKVEKVNLVERDDGSCDFLPQASLHLEQPLLADVISLGIGFIHLTHPPLVGQQGYFANVYESGMAAIAQVIVEHPSPPVNVVLLGTKAAALDVIYYLEHEPQLRAKVRLLAISSSGQTRYPAERSALPSPYLPTVLPNRLPTLTTSDALVEAVKQELDIGQAAGYTRLEVWRSVCAIGSLKIARRYLLPEEKRKFERDGQAEVRRLTSFTDPDSIVALNHLISDSILTVMSGQIQRVRVGAVENHPHFWIDVANANGVEEVKADIVINCLGTTPLTQSDDPLIASVINERLAMLNESGTGFCVKRDRAASADFFVVGPLTSGGEIENRQGEPEFHLFRHTMPYVLEDASAAGKAIAARLLDLMQ